jgi:hypothetical protein
MLSPFERKGSELVKLVRETFCPAKSVSMMSIPEA